MFFSASLGLGIHWTHLKTKRSRRKPTCVSVHSLNADWIENEKAKSTRSEQIPFVSTNDVVTSWFFSEMKADLNIMVANFRERHPPILDLGPHQAGNHEANVPFFAGDVETPELIRKSIQNSDDSFQARRAGSPATCIPTLSALLQSNVSIVSNWSVFYRNFDLRGDDSDRQLPRLHLPIMESGGLMTSIWDAGIIFDREPEKSEF